MSKTKKKSEEKPQLEKQFENGFDMFDRKPFAKQLTKIITRYTPLYEEAFVLSLNGSWGSGKTAFLEMWQHYLENQEEPYQVISINAWETDFDEEPLVPIISALYSHVMSKSLSKELKKSMQEGLGATALGINDVVAHTTGFNLQKILTVTEKENRNLRKIGEDLHKEYSFKKKAYETLRDELQKYTKTLGGKPLVIFVDELDRVRPDYAVKFLEAIKHIFSAKGVCFVIAVDKEQLEQSVKQLYGDIDFSNYYRRFITREANLPEISKIEFKGFLDVEFNPFFSKADGGGSVLPIRIEDKDKMIDVATAICKCFKFNPRKIKEWCRSLVHPIAIDTDDTVGMHQIYASMLLVAMSMDKTDGGKALYGKIRADKDYCDDMSKYIESLDYSGCGDKESRRKLFMHVSMAFSLRGRHYAYSTSSNPDNPLDVWGEYQDKMTPIPESVLGAGDRGEMIRHYSIQELRACLEGLSDAPENSNFHLLQQRMEMWNNLIGEKT
ncbi:MAG: hypothetical protein JKY51_07705 [Opitutaceae bacterium]|nr:hypothetical protein [Opitutaceae bacterium]